VHVLAIEYIPMLKYCFKAPAAMCFQWRKEKADLSTWVNLFNLGLYTLVFLMVVIIVFGVLWAKYCK